MIKITVLLMERLQSFCVIYIHSTKILRCYCVKRDVEFSFFWSQCIRNLSWQSKPWNGKPPLWADL